MSTDKFEEICVWNEQGEKITEEDILEAIRGLEVLQRELKEVHSFYKTKN
jgi:hypothetical protein